MGDMRNIVIWNYEDTKPYIYASCISQGVKYINVYARSIESGKAYVEKRYTVDELIDGEEIERQMLAQIESESE